MSNNDKNQPASREKLKQALRQDERLTQVKDWDGDALILRSDTIITSPIFRQIADHGWKIRYADENNKGTVKIKITPGRR